MGSGLTICPVIYFNNSVWELEAEYVRVLQRKSFVVYIFRDLTRASAGPLPSQCSFLLKVPTQVSFFWTFFPDRDKGTLLCASLYFLLLLEHQYQGSM